jgi:hypothetical protein
VGMKVESIDLTPKIEMNSTISTRTCVYNIHMHIVGLIKPNRLWGHHRISWEDQASWRINCVRQKGWRIQPRASCLYGFCGYKNIK